MPEALLSAYGPAWEHGLARLRQALGALGHVPLDHLCDGLINRLVYADADADADADDDIALVAIRTQSEDRA